MVDPRSANLWAITCYFNPVGYRRRLENYRIFRQRLKVPLVALELSFGEEFQLASGDADILVQLHSSSVLWQKERLLNVALRSLPDICTKVAWLDCDIVFESDDWIERASRALDEFALVHLFQDRNELAMDFTPENPNSWGATLKTESVVYKLDGGQATTEEVATTLGSLRRGTTNGLAWASTKDILTEFGLYDACIIGSGNIAILSAALGVPDHFARALEMNPRRTEHYLAWALPFFERVRSRVGYIPGRIYHLWHGDLVNRSYPKRHALFARFDFDPFTDIAVDQNGCWRWSSGKTEIHSFLRQYFESRKEDGM
jgi:hypothetical protein